MVQDCIRCRETIWDDLKMAQHFQKQEDVMYTYAYAHTLRHMRYYVNMPIR